MPMTMYDPEKEYLVNVLLKNGKIVPDLVLYGKDIEDSVKDIFKTYDSVKKVVVYDNETKDAVNIYK